MQRYVNDMINYIKDRANRRFKHLQEFYDQFEINIVGLEYYLYKRFHNHKWLPFILYHLFHVCFMLFWAWSLWYVSNAYANCLYVQTNMNNILFNGSFKLNISNMLLNQSSVYMQPVIK
jgi:hypothetical protein